MTRGGATASAMGTLITHRGLGAYLTGDRARPGIVLLQEWWGLNTQMRALADRLASAGRFQVVVPDLYHGKGMLGCAVSRVQP